MGRNVLLDYEAVNERKKTDRYQISNIEEHLLDLERVNIFSKLDMFAE